MINLYDSKFSRIYYAQDKWECVGDASIRRRQRMILDFQNYDVYGSLQRWPHRNMTKAGETDQNPSIAPFLFDFDLPSKSNYDLDTLPNRFDQVVSDARKLRDFLKEECDVNYPQYRVWLSGGYGIHILIHPEVLGINMPIYGIMPKMKNFAENLNDEIGLSTLDMEVYSNRRLLRHLEVFIPRLDSKKLSSYLIAWMI